jgi:4-hydroxy-2-oxoheptanedioate aldolase
MTVHDSRRQLRAALHAPGTVHGVFLKLPSPDVLDVAAAAGFDFAVVDLEHSTLDVGDAISLVRHADAIGYPALVRVPSVDAALINRLLENGAAGIQLSMLRRTDETAALVAATCYAPAGTRSVSLAHRTAEFGAVGLTGYLAAESDAPPVLVGQIETVETDPLPDLIAGLDVCFVGTTDLSVDLGRAAPGDPDVARAVGRVETAAAEAGVAFGGWAPSVDQVAGLGLAAADYVVIGSDVQLLAAALRAAAPRGEDAP